MKAKFIAFKVVKIVAGILFFGTLFGFGTMYLWNWLIPALFHGPLITFWQTVGLIVLSKILFGGFKGGGKHRGWGGNSMMKERWKEKMEKRMENMTEEEKEKWKSRCMHKFE